MIPGSPAHLLRPTGRARPAPSTVMIPDRARTVLVAALLSACAPAPTIRLMWDPSRDGRPEAGQEAHAATTPAEPAEPSEHARRMHTWFAELEVLRDHVVVGNREALASGAAQLVQRLELPGDFPEEWQRHVDELRAPAARLAEPDVTLHESAAALAKLTATCGACHQAIGVVERVEEALPDDGDPPEGATQDAVMHQHRWAAARMWEGLVVPSTRRWIRGTTAFVIVPDCPDDPAVGADDRCDHVRAVARRAHLAESRARQVALYGEVLATCAGCHTPPAPISTQ